MLVKVRNLWVCSLSIVATSAVASAGAARADQLIEEYRAFISQNDVYNSSGERLTKPWEIIRQDRANYHKFGRADEADYYDSFFASADNRETVERMIANGRIEPAAGAQVVAGNVFVRVRIYGSGTTGKAIGVTVE